VVGPDYTGSATGTLAIIAATNALVLAWPSTTNAVSFDRSDDLVKWVPFTSNAGQDGTLVISKENGSHFFRASTSGVNGPVSIPLTILGKPTP
jgi:hypothetical protein